MPNYGAQLGMQVGNALTGGIIGQGMGMINDQRQLAQQRALMADQEAANKRMLDYTNERQYQMWLKTGVRGQMEQLKKSGLNPALIYGNSGAGGTTGSASAGSIGQGTAPAGGGEMQAAMGMGMQMQLMQAQERVLNTQADKNEAEANKTKGIDTQETTARRDSLLQGIENAKAQEWILKVETRLKEIELGVMGDTVGERIARIVWESQRALEDMNMARNEAYISKETMETKVNMLKTELIGLTLKNALTKTQTELTKATKDKIPQELANEALKITQKWRELSQGEWRTYMENELKSRGLDIQETGQIIDALDNILKHK